MSDDTQIERVTDSIPDSLSSAVDTEEIQSMLEEDSLDAAGRELGRQVGREMGARIGRQLGPTVVSDIRERESPLTILRNAARRLLTILVRTLKNTDIEAGLSKLSDVGRRILSEDTVKEGIGSVLPSGVTDATDEEADEASEAQEEEDAEQETDTEGGEEGDVTEEGEGEAEESGEVEQGEESEAEEGEADEGGAVPDEMPGDVDLSADEIQDLTEDTYRELLETMSYRDLQSLAKDVGVKANLAQDEMTDRIVAKFSEEGEA